MPLQGWPTSVKALAGMSTGGATYGPDMSYVSYDPAAAAAEQWAAPMRAACRQGRNGTQGSFVGAPPALVRMSAHQLLVTVPVECLGVRHPAAIPLLASHTLRRAWCGAGCCSL